MSVRGAFEERYELLHRLGRGGMGEVWAAEDRALRRRVAVKFLRARSGDEDLPRLERRFTREARLTGRIGHPAVPAIHATGRCQDHRLYIVMELVDGRTLSELLSERGPLPLPLLAAVAAQTADVLTHAHRKKVIHRDLKLSNLMLTGNGTVKILDFGIAAALEPDADETRLTRSGETPGTPGFISPEQADGRDATAESDLYALGCVLYEIASGKPPFEVSRSASPWVLVYQHLHEKPPPLTEHRADLPSAFADLIMHLLAKDPADRPSAAEIQQVARALLEPQPSSRFQEAPEPPYSEPVSAPGSTHQLSPAALLQEARALEARDELGVAARIAAYLRESRRPLDDAECVPLRLALCDLWLAADDIARAYDGYVALGGALRPRRSRTDRDLLACRAGTARCLAGLGRTQEALNEFEALLPFQQHVFGPVNPAVLDTRYEIAVLMARGGRLRKARDRVRELTADQRRALPVDDQRLDRAEALLGRLDRLLDSG